MPALSVGSSELEWWQRAQAWWLAWVAADRRRSRALLVGSAACVVVVLVAVAAQPGFGRGAVVWW